MNAKIQHTFNKPTITPPRILNIILLIYKIIKTFSPRHIQTKTPYLACK